MDHHHQSITSPAPTSPFLPLTILLLLPILLLFLHRRLTTLISGPTPCKCDVCRTYVTRSWLTSGFRNLPDWYTHLLRQSPTSTIKIHVLNNAITADPRNVEYILRTKFENYPKGRPHTIILGDLLGRGIFVVDGDHWRFQRKMASLELGSTSIRRYAYDVLTSEIDSRLFPLFRSFSSSSSSSSSSSAAVVDLQDVFRRFSFDNICRFSFGIDPGCLRATLPDSEFAEAFDVASRLSAQRALETAPLIWKMKKMLNLGSEKKLKEAIGKVNFLAETIIRERRKMGYTGKKDLLSRFMASITDEKYLRDIVISFLLAGRDTVASALTVFFLLLAQNPEAEKKIRDESDRVLGFENRSKIPTFEQLKGLHYLHASLYEALRLYPPVQIDSKFAEEDDTLPDGTKVTKGTKVSFHPYAMGRMPQIWGEDCLEFKPERWLSEDDGVFKPVSPYKYPVFQAGMRVCLGKEMALVAMKVVGISIVRLFDVRLEKELGRQQQPEFVPGLTAYLKGGLKVVVRERDDTINDHDQGDERRRRKVL